MADKSDLSHIWLGVFRAGAPSDFFVERRDLEDDEPLSQFAESQGTLWYDHDFVEISFLSKPIPIRDLVRGHSYWEQYVEEVTQVASARGINEANVFVLASASQITEPRDVEGAGFELRYLCTHDCRY